MTTIADQDHVVTVGVDTHADVHVAAVLDERGRLLATLATPSTRSGHEELLEWARGFGRIDRVGVEGTGAYGAGLARFLTACGEEVVEVDRPDRRHRRQRGKTDTFDAEDAARAVLAGRATGTPKTRDGSVEAIRALRVARRSALKARTQAASQLHALVFAAPDELRGRLRDLNLKDLVAVCAASRPGDCLDPVEATRHALRSIARRHQTLTTELDALDGHLARLVNTAAPELLAIKGVGVEVAGALLVTAGDNPHRLRNEAAFAHLCGVAPLPASSGRTTRHRLSRTGDRAANHALWRIVLVRMTCDQRTRDYVTRRTQQGLTKREIIRCLKRYVAREIYRTLTT
jgi:transposase